MACFYALGNHGINLDAVVEWVDDPDTEQLRVVFQSYALLKMDDIIEIGPDERLYTGESRTKLLHVFGQKA